MRNPKDRKRTPFHIRSDTPKSGVRFIEGEGWAVKWKGETLPERHTERGPAAQQLTNLHDQLLRGVK